MVVLGASAGTAGAFARAAGHAATPARCGGQLWRLKNLSDPGRRSVVLTPKNTTLGAIVVKPYPKPVPNKRRTPFQRQNWEIVAQVTAFRLEDAGLRLILFDDGSYLNAVVPVPSCLTSASRGRTSMTGAWNAFGDRCPRPTRDWQSLGAVVYVSGVGFWSERDGTRGEARNGAELYPVTGFRVVVGCG